MRRVLAALAAVLVLAGGSMPIAPFVAAWGSRWPSMAAGPLAGAPSTAGVPFQSGPLLALYPNARLVVEAAFGANPTGDASAWSWTDITGDVRQADRQQITITPMGRSNEATTGQPAGCAFQLDNSTGRYTAYSINSPLWPYVRRNVPIRVTVNLTGFPADDSTRFFGFANGWVPRWDESANLAVVSVSASGVLRRLQQGRTPLLSALRRSYDFDPTRPVAYWPLEGGKDSGVAYDVISNAPSAVGGFTGLVDDNAGAPQFGVADLGLGSDAVANIGGGWNLDLNLPSGITATGNVTLQFSMAFGTTVRSGTYAKTGIRLDPTTAARHLAFNVFVNDSGLIELQWFEAGSAFDLLAGPTTAFSSGSENIFDGQPRQFQLDLAASGGTNVAWSLYENDALLGSGTITPSFAGAMNAPPYRSASVSIAGAEQTAALGHVAVFTTNPGLGRYDALNAHRGELATDRLTRLFAQQGVPLDIVGTSDTTMGPQTLATFLDLARECETADRGQLFDGRGPGCGYIARSAVYNQAATLTIDASAGQVPAGTFEPADNDQRNRNLVKATRRDGIPQTYEDATGPLGTAAIGVYDDAVTVNVDADAGALQLAAWIVHQGTVEGFRYPTLAIDLGGTAPELAGDWAALRLLGRIDVTNVSSRATQHPPGTVSVVAEGWAEYLSPFAWRAVANCSPAAPWDVGVLDTSGFIDCGATTLAEDLDTTETGIDVLIADTCVWAHDNGDYVIVIDDEEMTVTNVTAAAGSYPAQTQTFTVTRSSNGVVQGHGVGAAVHVRDPFIPAL
jgi:hypothetical protein